jgi:hypothetical protein
MEYGFGSLTVTPYGQTCSNMYGYAPDNGAHCPQLYQIGTVVHLVATPIPDSVFEGWMGACTGTLSTCDVTITRDGPPAVGALFRGPELLNIDVLGLDGGTGALNVSPFDLACSNASASDGDAHCPQLYQIGTVVHLVAVPASDSVFDGWVGACSGVLLTCDVTITRDGPPVVGAQFRRPRTLHVAVTGTGASSGSVQVEPGSLNCTSTPGTPAVCDVSQHVGASLTLTAVPSADSVFAGWSGACSGTGTCSITIADNTSVQATFNLRNRSPHASAGGPYAGFRHVPIAFNGGGSSDPDGDTLSYAWDFGDGATGGSASPSHTYTTPGPFTVTLVVSDGTVASAPVTATVTLTNRAPVANAGPDQTVEVGTTATLNGGGSSDPDSDALTYTWRDGSSTLLGSGPTLTVTAGRGTYPLTLTVTDPFGASSSDDVVVTVRDTTLPSVAVADPSAVNIFTGLPFPIRWIATDNDALAGFDVAFSTDGGASYTAITACTGLGGAARSCTWTPPNTASTQARIRVTARDAAGNSNTGTSSFTLVVPTVAVTSPNTAATWGIGSTRTITWTSNAGGPVEIAVGPRTTGPWMVIGSAVPNNGSFTWVVSGSPITTARFRVRWTTNLNVSGVNGADVKIEAAKLAVTAPNTTGISWTAGSSHAITWSHNLGTAASIKIDVSRDSGSTWSTIEAAAANGDTMGTFNWTVNGPTTTHARVRVTWTANTGLKDVNDFDFRIR